MIKFSDIPNYIKIDVDGIEHLILKGGIKLLKNIKIVKSKLKLMKIILNNLILKKIMNECMFVFKEKKEMIKKLLFRP